MSAFLAVSIEARAKRCEEALHTNRKVSFRREQAKMKMIGHDGVGVDLPVEEFQRLIQRFEERMNGTWVAEDRLPVIAAIEDMIDTVSMEGSALARHET